MNEYISINNDQDIERFLSEANGLHDGYIIGVEYCNDGIKCGENEFSFNLSKLCIKVMVTSICDAIVELLFEEVAEWQIKCNWFEITDTSVSIDENGFFVWIDDMDASPENRADGSYVIAKRMKWRMK